MSSINNDASYVPHKILTPLDFNAKEGVVFKAPEGLPLKTKIVATVIFALLATLAFVTGHFIIGSALLITGAFIAFSAYRTYKQGNPLLIALKILVANRPSFLGQNNLDELPEFKWEKNGSFSIKAFKADEMSENMMSLKEEGKTFAVAVRINGMVRVYSFTDRFTSSNERNETFCLTNKIEFATTEANPKNYTYDKVVFRVPYDHGRVIKARKAQLDNPASLLGRG